ncbi:Formyltransferase [Hypoxylon trugodes]|uniref:Formyltransferase n=1 Tax=Hypoxylon trugodes TaxID=326681 RepID=UPI00219BCC95|nr:Formyltransferase [Hypoxylon trugodes]KAI1389495.1 Formyltransferase [Hypoxylon trugodes]
MQPLLRQASAATRCAKPWRSLAHSPAKANAFSPRLFSSATHPRTLVKTSTSILCECHRHRQIRSYSNTTTDPIAFTENTNEESSSGRQKKKSDPLHILFCGTDKFSCAALEALFSEHIRNPDLIRSIDVVVRPGKRTGRGYKVIQHPPLKTLAEKLELPIHERDTFTGWDPPEKTNLIIAVSFGLFVPPRLLLKSQYGGLNVHPSYLPDLRGPAPLQHALLAGRQTTGVSLQTLDHTHFDAGKILARSTPITIPENETLDILTNRIAPIGATLLIRNLQAGVHVPPLSEEPPSEAVKAYWAKLLEEGTVVKTGASKQTNIFLHAPKITKTDSQLLPSHLNTILQRYRALGPLWFISRDRNGVRKRIIITHVSPQDTDDAYALQKNAEEAKTNRSYSIPFIQNHEDNTAAVAEDEPHIVLNFPGDSSGRCNLGKFRIDSVKVEGQPEKSPEDALRNFLVPLLPGRL